MEELRIRLFGTVSIHHGDRPSRTRLPDSALKLLAFLLLHREHPYRREYLAGRFWEDYPETRARNNLASALWRLRRALEPDDIPKGTYLLTPRTGELCFNCASSHWIDVFKFENGVSRVLSKPPDVVTPDDMRSLESAAELYTGELLEGFYDDWVIRERERLRLVYLNSLVQLMKCHTTRGDIEQAISVGRLILADDPLRESVHRELILLLIASGRRAAAMRQFEKCREMLRRELGVEPMPETWAAIGRVAPSQATSQAPIVVSNGSDPQQALNELRLARQEFAHAQERLQAAIQLVERLSGTFHGENGHSS